MAQPVVRGRIRFAPREVDVRYRADGTILLRSPMPLTDRARHICVYLERWAGEAPDRTFLAQRGPGDPWQRLGYGEAWRRARAIGQALLEHGLGPDRPLAILTGNSIEHALMTFGAMMAGVPAAPISPGYSTSAGGLKRLAEIVDMLKPGIVFAQSAGALAGARALPQLSDLPWISVVPTDGAEALASFEQVGDCAAVDDAFASADGDTVAKILFTSGSTGSPKGVPNTQRMICSDTRAISMLLIMDQTPVTVDWMPWHHSFGGNTTLLGVLRDGGTMYIDDGLPLPGHFQKTIRNLTEIAPTIVQMVPAGFEMLVPAMETDAILRERFFSRLQRIGFAGAALSPDIFHRIQALATRTTGYPIPIVAGYGTTETGPGISNTHWFSEGKGELGLPFPGCEMKLVPFEDRYDVRVRGDNVFKGYLQRPDLTAAAFDDEGFYRIGDAVQFLDPADPSRGLRFAGRLSENFKLANGSWVPAGELRTNILSAAPGISDAVVAGHDRADVRLLVWLAADLIEHLTPVHGDQARTRAADQVRAELEAYNLLQTGATRRVAAFHILDRRPSLATGELTDKGSINPRAVLANCADVVERLYAGADGTLVCRRPTT